MLLKLVLSCPHTEHVLSILSSSVGLKTFFYYTVRADTPWRSQSWAVKRGILVSLRPVLLPAGEESVSGFGSFDLVGLTNP